MDDPGGRPIVWLHGEIRTPPFKASARIEAGWLLRRLQNGERLSMPHSRPMPSIGGACHELRVNDESAQWRVIYRIEPDAIVILEVFAKRTPKTPRGVIETCKRRLKDYLRCIDGN
jgi:phage-related protein